MKPRFASAPVNLGHGYSVEFEFRPEGLFVEWTPNVPGSSAPEAVFDRYMRARNVFIAARCSRIAGEIRSSLFGPIVTVLRGDA